jgi:toluene monooxygenase system protein D
VSVLVGPVLTGGATARAVGAAILATHPEARIDDHGGYLRVLVPVRCVLTRAAVESMLGEPFELPADLERIMPSFRGRISFAKEQVTWE